jgi:hypothetical protein
MIDGFVLLTPILVLAIVALLGFVGCDRVFGLGDVHSPSLAPNNINPNKGPTKGGQTVTISGTGLGSAKTVDFGGAQSSVSSPTDSMITVTTPQVSSGGVVDVTVISSDTDSNGNPLTATLSQAYTYYALNFVQAAGTSQATSPPLSVSLNNTTQGNLLIAAVQFGGTPSPSVSVSDNLGNTFTLAGSATWLRHAQIFYLPNIPGGNVTLTAVGMNGAAGPCSICVSEYSGADPTSAAVYGFSPNASPSAGTAGVEAVKGVAVAPASPDDLVYIVVFAARSNSVSLIPGSGFTQHPSTIGDALIEEIATSVTTTQAIATVNTTGFAFAAWVALAVAIKAG